MQLSEAELKRESLETHTAISPGKQSRHVHYESDNVRVASMTWTGEGPPPSFNSQFHRTAPSEMLTPSITENGQKHFAQGKSSIISRESENEN